MSELTDKYSKNFSDEKRKEFEKRVRDTVGISRNESRGYEGWWYDRQATWIWRCKVWPTAKTRS